MRGQNQLSTGRSRAAYRLASAFPVVTGLLLVVCGLAGCADSTETAQTAVTVAAAGKPADDPIPAHPPLTFASIGRASAGEAKTLEGRGGTFPRPLYRAWFEAYGANQGLIVNYDAKGSSAGIKAITNRQVDFGASDKPMTNQQLRKAKGGAILHIPTAFGAIVLSYNLPGLPPDQRLRFTPRTLAAIYLGEIRLWNDPQLVRDNPVLARIGQPIIVVHRGDGSGTTFGFTNYLSTADATWRQKVSEGTSVAWPVGIGAIGNGGVASEIQANPYAIGYVELGYALEHKMPYAQMKNAAGQFVEANIETISAAVADSGRKEQAADLRFSIVNAAGADAYPLCTGTWIMVYRDNPDAAKAKALARLLWWATHDGQSINAALRYAPVPSAITARSEQLIHEINSGGKAAF